VVRGAIATSDEDHPVYILFFAYFKLCHLVYLEHQKLEVLRRSNSHFLEEEKQQILGASVTYLHLWLALLYVVAEGFKELGLSHPKITPLIDEHWSELRCFRNSVFHFQKNTSKRELMHDLLPLNWARDLHAVLQEYFVSQGT